MIYYPYIALFERLNIFLYSVYLMELLHCNSCYRHFAADCEFPGEVQEIKTDLEKCGTKAYFNSTHVIYKNEVRYIPHIDILLSCLLVVIFIVV